MAGTLVQTQMFPSLAARETHVAEANFVSWKQGNVPESSGKHFSFTEANFASQTFSFQLSHLRKHVWKKWFGNNVSWFNQAPLNAAIHWLKYLYA